jgi:hypothetical protein
MFFDSWADIGRVVAIVATVAVTTDITVSEGLAALVTLLLLQDATDRAPALL